MAPAFAANCPAAATRSGTVAAILDGETLRLADGSTVRLAGIDVPSPPLASPIGVSWPAGEAAASALRTLVQGASIGIAPTSDSPDRYGRLHAFIFFSDGRSLQAEMIGKGLARARWLPGDGACFQSLLAGEKPARAAHLGLWSSPATGILQADDPSLLQRTGLYALIEGRLVSVGRGNPMIFLDFGRNFRRDLTVMVSPQVARKLMAAGVSVDDLPGKRVRVRGVIDDSNGPAIRLNDAAELEVIDDEASPGASP